MQGGRAASGAAGMSLLIKQVARFRIELRELEPMIWRRVDVPLSSTLGRAGLEPASNKQFPAPQPIDII